MKTHFFSFDTVLLSSCLVLVCGMSQVSADLITAVSGHSSAETTIDFAQFAGTSQFTPGPVQIGAPVGENVEFRTWGNGFIGNQVTTLGGNGSWDFSRTGYTFTNGSGNPDNFIRFDFAGAPVSSVGGFLNYELGSGPVLIQALDAGGGLLEQYDLAFDAPINTGGAPNSGAFRGITRTLNEIHSFVVRGANAVLDDLSFSRVADAPPTPVNQIAAAAEFGVQNSGDGDPAGQQVTNSTNAEVGNISGGGSSDVRGFAEFDTSSVGSVTEAILNFTIEAANLASAPGAAFQVFDVVIEAYAANSQIDTADFQAPALVTVGSFSTGGLVPGDPLSFDVTGLVNGGPQELGFRLRQANENDGRQLGYTFGDFAISFTSVPEPSSLTLLLLMGVSGLARRQKRGSTRLERS